MPQDSKPVPQKPPERMLDIDPDNLDVECQEQPRLMRYWLRQLAVANKRHRDAKRLLKRVTAEARSRARGAGASKVDEVNDAMALDPEYQRAEDDCDRLEYEADLIKANTQALASRDWQLSNLGKLLELGYWNAPRVDPATRERYKSQKRLAEDMADRAARKAAE